MTKSTVMQNRAKILAPVGSYECLSAAIKAGANIIYFGIDSLNMRARTAANFSLKDLQKINDLCKDADVHTCLTLNTLVYDRELSVMKKIIDKGKAVGIDAIIVSDLAAVQYAASVKQTTHLSTLLNISNIDTVLFFAAYADVMVLARELTLRQIEKICNDIQTRQIKGPGGKLVQVEIFAHGALCVAISGKCHMSLTSHNSSANRGACYQNCRRRYRVTDDDSGTEFVLDNQYVMSPKDLSTIGMIDKIVKAGVSVLKIEGRLRKAEYVYTVTKAYKEAIDAFYDGNYNEQSVTEWEKQLKSVYNRGFWENGYYLGKKLGEWSGPGGSKAESKKVYAGFANKHFRKAGIGEFTIMAGVIKIGDTIVVTGRTTGFLKCIVESMHVDGKPAEVAKKGDIMTMLLPEKVRPNDKLFLYIQRGEVE